MPMALFGTSSALPFATRPHFDSIFPYSPVSAREQLIHGARRSQKKLAATPVRSASCVANSM